MKIIELDDGSYVIRKITLFGYRYRDLRNPSFWWSKASEFFSDCKGTYAEAKLELEYMKYVV
jgi:hypothetical protein